MRHGRCLAVVVVVMVKGPVAAVKQGVDGSLGLCCLAFWFASPARAPLFATMTGNQPYAGASVAAQAPLAPAPHFSHRLVCLCILLQSTLFDSALHVVPGSAKVQLNVGIERWREGKLQLASRHLSTAERIDPEYCQVHYWFARVHLDAKDYDVRVAGATELWPLWTQS